MPELAQKTATAESASEFKVSYHLLRYLASILVVNLIILHTILQGLLHLPPVALLSQVTKSDVTCGIPLLFAPYGTRRPVLRVRCERMPPQ